ncbi:MAG: hypothetical protein B9S32_14555 [Verrucomicrobia bacterium Tous-C9LFEB]|nr:MAG: hypothetical protein B9S32_14555 [Verrucomicrobia bacterium Tous-C9LFEB]
MYFLTSVLGLFLPAALLLGLSWAGRPAASPRRLLGISLLFAVVGVVLGRALPTNPTTLLYASLAQILLLLFFLASQKLASTWIGYLWQGILIGAGAFRWGQDRNLNAFTATGIINTDLLVNLTAVVFGFGLLTILALQVAAICRLQPRLRWPLLAAFTALLLVPLIGDSALALIKLKAINLTTSHLSFTARATDFATRLPYIYPLVFMHLVFWLVWKVVIPRRAACRVEDPILRRKALADYRYAFRLAAGSLVVVAVALASQWYWDSVASQPPKLSQTTRLTLAEDGQIHLPLSTFADNDLHRFDWVAEDGKVVRFFALNRYNDRQSVTTVFDSCMLCGDKGYALREGQVVCIACGVRLFLPSVGTPGGCNPIPMSGWKVVGDELIIPKDSIEAGMKYFTTVEEQQVTDPVNGEKMLSSNARRSYEFGAKTYFFSNEKNYETFVATPEKYVKKTKTKSCCPGS